ncbi:MAG: hypothetical protein QGG36_25350 [Pirellulaceae bacterium]|jgi:hypothetical protein|nr:hypothetical protein [Pirellulaceae bacterium]MDP7019148.1 hypothetical protein [Pirellulaceae bacterium]
MSHPSITRWIEQIEEFRWMSIAAKRAYKHQLLGYIDREDRQAYDDEQIGCAHAIELLESLAASEEASEAELQVLAIQALRGNGRRSHENPDELSVGIRWAIAVVEGAPERYYNSHHPARRNESGEGS